MLLKYPSAHLQSLSELKSFSSAQFTNLENLKSTNLKQMVSSSLRKRNSEFIPFCKQRDLGKLIPNKHNSIQNYSASKSLSKKLQNQDLLDIVNFKNFKKLYNMQKKNQEVVYALKVRNSGQKNLINENQWQIKSLRKRSLSNSSLKVQNQTKISKEILRKCCNQRKDSNLQKNQKSKQAFDKIDVQLYKKIALNRPPNSNPELQKLFQHYIQACQLNQNERRKFLTQRKM